MANYVLWPAAHFINFRFVPTEHRILYNNCVSVRVTHPPGFTAHAQKPASSPEAGPILLQPLSLHMVVLQVSRVLYAVLPIANLSPASFSFTSRLPHCYRFLLFRSVHDHLLMGRWPGMHTSRRCRTRPCSTRTVCWASSTRRWPFWTASSPLAPWCVSNPETVSGAFGAGALKGLKQ